MNTKLVDSIVQVIQSLSEAEQKALITRLNTLIQTPESLPEVTMEGSAEDKHPDGWDVFLSLGEDATPGKLENPSIHHDRYLYQQP